MRAKFSTPGDSWWKIVGAVGLSKKNNGLRRSKICFVDWFLPNLGSPFLLAKSKLQFSCNDVTTVRAKDEKRKKEKRIHGIHISKLPLSTLLFLPFQA